MRRAKSPMTFLTPIHTKSVRGPLKSVCVFTPGAARACFRCVPEARNRDALEKYAAILFFTLEAWQPRQWQQVESHRQEVNDSQDPPPIQLKLAQSIPISNLWMLLMSSEHGRSKRLVLKLRFLRDSRG